MRFGCVFKYKMKDKAFEIRERINKSQLSIYSDLSKNNDLYLDDSNLKFLIEKYLIGENFSDLPLRTRSKRVKTLICSSMGYEIPKSFKKTQPKFPGQNFDVYIQKTSNLQIWNEEISDSRRYVIIILNSKDVVTRIHILLGSELYKYDKTGTFTTKYQARFTGDLESSSSELVNNFDTLNLRNLISKKEATIPLNPSLPPTKDSLISISNLYQILKSLINKEFPDPGLEKERTRGAILQKIVCDVLGYKEYDDTGQFPDLLNQLLEIKLQTSPTIDLGLILPNCDKPLQTGNNEFKDIKYKDARFAIFLAESKSNKIKLKKFVLVTGESFFDRFQQFKGKTINKKLQLRLPEEFFNP